MEVSRAERINKWVLETQKTGIYLLCTLRLTILQFQKWLTRTLYTRGQRSQRTGFAQPYCESVEEIIIWLYAQKLTDSLQSSWIVSSWRISTLPQRTAPGREPVTGLNSSYYQLSLNSPVCWTLQQNLTQTQSPSWCRVQPRPLSI